MAQSLGSQRQTLRLEEEGTPGASRSRGQDRSGGLRSPRVWPGSPARPEVAVSPALGVPPGQLTVWPQESPTAAGPRLCPRLAHLPADPRTPLENFGSSHVASEDPGVFQKGKTSSFLLSL